MSGDEQWRCQWCTKWGPVPSIVRDHERVCPANPENRQTVRGTR